jgi:hypothetical protein
VNVFTECGVGIHERYERGEAAVTLHVSKLGLSRATLRNLPSPVLMRLSKGAGGLVRGTVHELSAPLRRATAFTTELKSCLGAACGLAVSTHATTSFSPSRSARSRGERLRPAAVFEP